MSEEQVFLEDELRRRALAAEQAQDFDELFAVAGELYHLVGELRAEIEALEEENRQDKPKSLPCNDCRDGQDLAHAVVAFADWQYQGYEGWTEAARQDVGRQLWFEVSDRVRRATGCAPAAPGFDAESDA